MDTLVAKRRRGGYRDGAPTFAEPAQEAAALAHRLGVPQLDRIERPVELSDQDSGDADNNDHLGTHHARPKSGPKDCWKFTGDGADHTLYAKVS